MDPVVVGASWFCGSMQTVQWKCDACKAKGAKDRWSKAPSLHSTDSGAGRAQANQALVLHTRVSTAAVSLLACLYLCCISLQLYIYASHRDRDRHHKIASTLQLAASSASRPVLCCRPPPHTKAKVNARAVTGSTPSMFWRSFYSDLNLSRTNTASDYTLSMQSISRLPRFNVQSDGS